MKVVISQSSNLVFRVREKLYEFLSKETISNGQCSLFIWKLSIEKFSFISESEPRQPLPATIQLKGFLSFSKSL